MEKIKVEIIIENIFLDRLSRALDDLGVAGYTVLEIVEGKGAKGGYQKNFGVTDINKKNLVLVISDKGKEQLIIDAASKLVRGGSGIAICSAVSCYEL